MREGHIQKAGSTRHTARPPQTQIYVCRLHEIPPHTHTGAEHTSKLFASIVVVFLRFFLRFFFISPFPVCLLPPPPPDCLPLSFLPFFAPFVLARGGTAVDAATGSARGRDHHELYTGRPRVLLPPPLEGGGGGHDAHGWLGAQARPGEKLFFFFFLESSSSSSSLVLRPLSFVLRPSSFILRSSSFVLYPSSFVLRPPTSFFSRLLCHHQYNIAKQLAMHTCTLYCMSSATDRSCRNRAQTGPDANSSVIYIGLCRRSVYFLFLPCPGFSVFFFTP